MKIKEITVSDIETVRKLLKSTWIETYGSYYSKDAIEKITSNWHDPEKLLLQSQDPNIYFASAKENNIMLGVITVKRMPDRSLFLSRLYIDPKYQGKGIGSRLMDSAIEHFPGAKIFRVECEKQNGKACAFYLNKGFKITGEKEEIMEGVKMITLEYEKIIK